MKFEILKHLVIYDEISLLSFGILVPESDSKDMFFGVLLKSETDRYLCSLFNMDDIIKLNEGETDLRTCLEFRKIWWTTFEGIIFQTESDEVLLKKNDSEFGFLSKGEPSEEYLPESGFFLTGFLNGLTYEKQHGNGTTSVIEGMDVLTFFKKELNTVLTDRENKIYEIAKRDGAGMIIFRRIRDLTVIERKIESIKKELKLIFKNQYENRIKIDGLKK